jgi:hypothetical protein
MVDRLRAAVRPHQPTGPFEALSWSSLVVRRMLGAAFFAGRLLADFLAPLQVKNPGPLLPRPLLFRRLNAAIARVLSDPPEGTISAAMSSVDNAVEEIRVALFAGYDTTAHTLAWALWHLADEPRWCHRDVLGLALDETCGYIQPGGSAAGSQTATPTRAGWTCRPERWCSTRRS